MRRSVEQRKAFCEAAAAHMAANPTGAEERLWRVLEPLGFWRQTPFGGETKNGLRWHYIADFYRPGAGLVIEVDGGDHARTKGRDRRRTERLRIEHGIRVIRFSNNQVLKKLDEVRARIVAEMEGA